MDDAGKMTGDVVGMRHGRGSVVEVTTATSILAYLGTCDACMRPVREDPGKDKGKVTVITCPDCGGDLAAERMVATYTDEVCATECRGAYGKDCQCACGGANHGRIWGMRLNAEELTESEAREQKEALLRYLRKSVAVLERLAESQAKNAEERAEAFSAWLETGDTEELVADVLESKDPRLARYRKMIENGEPLSHIQENRARRYLMEAASAK